MKIYYCSFVDNATCIKLMYSRTQTISSHVSLSCLMASHNKTAELVSARTDTAQAGSMFVMAFTN